PPVSFLFEHLKFYPKVLVMSIFLFGFKRICAINYTLSISILLVILSILLIIAFTLQPGSASAVLAMHFVNVISKVNNKLNHTTADWYAFYILVRKFAHSDYSVAPEAQVRNFEQQLSGKNSSAVR
ncbi:hypothetical protein ACTNEN_13200, partial [Oribacterium sp. HCP28S3_H8]|uniref:hypothetical protein n=1 Tax=Oribacterium sp. HCP28S3_H8 TaxID=3438945 RepID=UPI003F8A106E